MGVCSRLTDGTPAQRAARRLLRVAARRLVEVLMTALLETATVVALPLLRARRPEGFGRRTCCSKHAAAWRACCAPRRRCAP